MDVPVPSQDASWSPSPDYRFSPLGVHPDPHHGMEVGMDCMDAPPSLCVRDVINTVAGVAMCGCGLLVAMRGRDPNYHIAVGCGIGVWVLFGAWRTYENECEADDIFVLTGNAFALGYFGAYYLHSRGGNKIPEMTYCAIAGFQVGQKNLAILREKPHTAEEAVALIKDIFVSATEREVNTGDGLQVQIIRPTGITVEEYPLRKD